MHRLHPFAPQAAAYRLSRPFALLLAGLLALLAACARPATGVELASLEPFEVGVRRMHLQRGEGRPLPVIIWYPATQAGADAPVAEGRFPIVIFSHGLGGQPEGFAGVTEPLAAAGFVVVAPAYPHTKKGAARFDRHDVRNQPADAQFVLGEVARLHDREGDLFRGRLAPSRMCAAGFSAGGFTTSGMFTQAGDARVRCGIVIAAGAMDGGFTGRAAPILFLHGDADTVVAFHRGRTAYDKLSWPKAFVTMHRQGHGEFLDPQRPGFAPASAAITDFLRWNLYHDLDARRRLVTVGTEPGIATLEDRLS